MQITNKHNLPHEIYTAIAQNNYDAGKSDYSVTTLLQPPRITQLTRRYYSELSEDAMDRVFSLFGEIAHDIFDRCSHEEAKTEERLYVTILDRCIGGKFDHYNNQIITDYKVTSAWTLVYGSRIKEWTEQLNFYAHLFRSEGHEVRQLRICAILRDWDKNKAKQNPSYPQTPIVIIPLTLWGADKAEEEMTERLAHHKAAEDLTDDQLPECSSEDMWEQSTKYALMKVGRKTAVKVFDDKDQAEWELEDKHKDHYLQTRCGKRTRCEDGYCSVRDYCSQYKDYKENLNNG